jgi:aminopeptidase N
MFFRIAASLLILFIAPLRADDGYERRTGLDVAHYRIAIAIADTGREIRGEADLFIDITAGEVARIPLDFGALTVDGALADGDTVAFAHAGERLTVAPNKPYRAGDRAHIRIRYHGAPQDGLFLKANKFGHRAVFADNWPNRAHHWFPGIDHPGDKATVEFIVTAPEGYDVVANGRLTETTALPNGTRRTHWQAAAPIPTYCMVIGTARFSVIHAGTWDGIPVVYYLFPEDRDNGLADFDRSLRMLEFYAGLIGPYPYEKLGLVQSSTRFGGMENASAIFFDEKAITGTGRLEGTVAHEIAHQWFGDAVTEADWHHLWLSEGFATYFGALFFERADGRDRFLEMMQGFKAQYLRVYAKNPGAVYDPQVADLFKLLNAYNYQKGGWVLHMLRGLMGDAAFFAGIRDYYRAYRDRTALTEDFQRVMAFHAGRPLDWFFRQWIYEPGHPVFEAVWDWDAKKKEARVGITQTQPQTAFRTPLDLVFYIDGAPHPRRVDITGREHAFAFPLDAPPERLALDPDEWVLKEAKVERRK